MIALSGLRSAARRKAGEIFDEPYNGTDPEGIVWMKGFHRWRRRAARCWSPAASMIANRRNGPFVRPCT